MTFGQGLLLVLIAAVVVCGLIALWEWRNNRLRAKETEAQLSAAMAAYEMSKRRAEENYQRLKYEVLAKIREANAAAKARVNREGDTLYRAWVDSLGDPDGASGPTGPKTDDGSA